MSEVIPEGWSLEPLASCIAESIAGEWGSDANGDSNDIPVLRSTNFTNSGKIDYTKIVYRNIDARKRVKKKLNKGDIVLEKSGGSPTQPVGRVVYFDRDTPFLYSNFTQKLVVQQGHDQKYVFYKFLAEYEDGTILKFQQQTTGIINFQLSEYLLYQTLLAPLPEQQKIATILSSVDDVIEKTRAQIDKLKDLKTGMMQELLTRGIGHTEFKDSPVGRIPASWAATELGLLLDKIFDCEHKTAPYVDQSRYMVIRTSNIRDGELVLRDMRYTTADAYREWTRRTTPRFGDILFTREAPAGESCLVPEGMSICMGQRLVLLRPNKDMVSAEFLSLYLNSKMARAVINDLSIGTTVKRINIEDIEKILCALPSLEEQFQISTAIYSIQRKLSSAIEKLNCLESVKKALMQDLLTGKVRVEVNPTETVAT